MRMFWDNLDDKINFVFEIRSENVFVNKVNIYGNNITSEEFIRDNLIVDEGDPLIRFYITSR